MPSDPPENLSAAARTFAEQVLARLAEGDEREAERLCSARPDLGRELIELVSAKARAGRAPEGDRGEGSLRPEALFFRREERQPPASGPGLAEGRVVGGYELISLVAQGGMGQVWRARQLSLGSRTVALKFVRPDRVSRDALERFHREARAGGRLHHPGIVTVYDHGEDRGLAWIAMELVESGTTLRDSIDEIARLDEVPPGYDRSVARIAAEVADALQAAHAANVIHRDLKPQNVLILPDGRPKVTDFGLAKLTDESALSHSGEIAGTYFYMSPEQVAGRRMGIDHRTDVFSLGVLLYELLTLTRPFQGDTNHQVAAQIVTKDPPDPRTIRSRIPRDLVVIVGKALEKDRDRRYATMAALAADLRRFLADEPIHAMPPTTAERVVKWARRHPTGSVAGAVAAAAFLAISLLLAENVRARGEVELKNTELDLRNTDLARTIRERDDEIASVKRLSALQDLEDLIAEADDAALMWPPNRARIPRYVRWIERAEGLVAELPAHRRTRQALREQAPPRTEEQRLKERREHPRHRELQLLRGELESARRQLEQRRDGVEAELPELGGGEYPDDPRRLLALARPLVASGRLEHGREPLGLALVRRALELADEADPVRTELLAAAADASFALGRDDDALNLAYEALDGAREVERERYAETLQALEAAVAEAQDPASLAALEREVAALEERCARLDALVDARRTWFGEEHGEARWWNSQLTKLIEGLEALEEERTGLLGASAVSPLHGWSVPRRLAFARRLEEASAPGGEHARRWEEALPRIAQAYPGLALAPRSGLVPIGPDPASGLWEFWHIQTGSEPERGADGRLRIDGETGLVLVLLPGGTLAMGAQSGDPSGRSYDAEAAGNEGPVHEVELSPCWISKYEMTQGQWERVLGANPSRWHPDGELQGVTLRHPVETVDWHEARRALAMLGLQLPSEAQWEYACRAGTTAPFSCAREELADHANLADRVYASIFRSTVVTGDWSDGFGGHAPVGSLAPNPWGLHDMHGNVWEWCLDGYREDSYQHAPPVDPVAPWQDTATRVYRGGSFNGTPIRARSAYRFYYSPSLADGDLGLRPAASLAPQVGDPRSAAAGGG